MKYADIGFFGCPGSFVFFFFLAAPPLLLAPPLGLEVFFLSSFFAFRSAFSALFFSFSPSSPEKFSSVSEPA